MRSKQFSNHSHTFPYFWNWNWGGLCDDFFFPHLISSSRNVWKGLFLIFGRSFLRSGGFECGVYVNRINGWKHNIKCYSDFILLRGFFCAASLCSAYFIYCYSMKKTAFFRLGYNFLQYFYFKALGMYWCRWDFFSSTLTMLCTYNLLFFAISFNIK